MTDAPTPAATGGDLIEEIEAIPPFYSGVAPPVIMMRPDQRRDLISRIREGARVASDLAAEVEAQAQRIAELEAQLANARGFASELIKPLWQEGGHLEVSGDSLLQTASSHGLIVRRPFSDAIADKVAFAEEFEPGDPVYFLSWEAPPADGEAG